jgi:tetratricopeptide (TPR) repeat protein
MDLQELLERYEARGDEADYDLAKDAYEQAVATAADPEALLGFGYLLECHARNELRRALECYMRAIELDPDADKPVYQLIGAHAGLRQPEEAIAYCEARLAAKPESLREHRLLASAYLAAGEHAGARRTIEHGLALAPDDPVLIAERGELKAATADPAGALADWQQALELEPDDIGPLYSSAFLLERQGRPGEAAAAWRAILHWNESRGFTLQTEWPKQELARLEQIPD